MAAHGMVGAGEPVSSVQVKYVRSESSMVRLVSAARVGESVRSVKKSVAAAAIAEGARNTTWNSIRDR
jgi:uncharacterized Zn-binding protein involved in type VI secretion